VLVLVCCQVACVLCCAHHVKWHKLKLFSYPLTSSCYVIVLKRSQKLFAEKKRLRKRMPLVYNKLLMLGPLSHTLSSVLTHHSPSPSPSLSHNSTLSCLYYYCLCAVILTLYFLQQPNSTVPPLSHKLTHTHEHKHKHLSLSLTRLTPR